MGIFKWQSIVGAALVLFSQVLSAQNNPRQLELKNKNFGKLVDRSLDFTVPIISVQELKANPDKYIILDAREPEEYNTSHIPGAIHIGYDNPDLSVLDTVAKDCELLFYCSIGYRSEKIGEKAKELGFSKVSNLYGSIFEWVNHGYEVEDVKGKPTQKVHAYNRVWGVWIKNKSFKKIF